MRTIRIQAAIGVLAVAAMLISPQAGFAVPPDRELTWPGGGRGVVKFEGEEHAKEGFKCDACHPGIFEMKHGAAKMTMAEMNKGRFCGTCHNGKITFSTADPRKCHECHQSKWNKSSGHHSDEKHEGKHKE
ncbi:MAG: cytochrome C [Nitrospirae bacterium]|nr:cytochrome C [Nitrospirota bacterium]